MTPAGFISQDHLQMMIANPPRTTLTFMPCNDAALIQFTSSRTLSQKLMMTLPSPSSTATLRCKTHFPMSLTKKSSSRTFNNQWKSMVKRLFMLLNLETSNKAVDVFDHLHSFKVDDIINHCNARLTVNDNSACDSFKKDDVRLSRLSADSRLTCDHRQKTATCHGHVKNFKKSPGLVRFLMAFETCNACVKHDIQGAKKLWDTLLISDACPGEDVTDLCTKALCLMKILQSDCALPVNLGSSLLHKTVATSCKRFNHKVHSLRDETKDVWGQHDLKDLSLLEKDKNHAACGPFGLVASPQQLHGRHVADCKWPAPTKATIPKSNLSC